ncbi:uncharacterized protein LOC9651814 [Selaginella moellendorffii]|nr:uncharacterized protein LOC9651814 [Selaginella moellendorffii]|eukprot:XP_002987745.2 uncharacterized protein LOC9651814 [Selaginella moellendorffii]
MEEATFRSFVALWLKGILDEAAGGGDGSLLPPSFAQALLAADPCVDQEPDCLEDELELVRSCCQVDLDKACIEGVPAYPLYKQLAANLCRSLEDSKTPVLDNASELEEGEDQRDRKREFHARVKQHLAPLAEAFHGVRFRLHVQDRFLSQLRDGSKIVEGRCATGFYSRIRPGDYLLFNGVLIMETKDVRAYESFQDMLETEGLENVLPGIESVEEGIGIYRGFYSRETEALGVLALHVSQPIQPRNAVTALLQSLKVEGVASLLGLRATKGTLVSALPPPRSRLLASFLARNSESVPSSKLTVGGRALAKHVNRSSAGWWGACSGTETAKNKVALKAVCRIIDQASWMNTHHLPQSTHIFEIRVQDGYGARWSSDGKQFRGFVEPPMKDGHSSKWRH